MVQTSSYGHQQSSEFSPRTCIVQKQQYQCKQLSSIMRSLLVQRTVHAIHVVLPMLAKKIMYTGVA